MVATDIFNSIRYLIDFVGHSINSPLKEKEAILIFGAARSGTTWIMEILETLPDYKSIFEPFHPDWFPEVRKLKNIGSEINSTMRPYLYFKE